MTLAIIQGSSHKPERAEVNVVIDVIRAFTVAHHAFLMGAREIILSPTIDAAFRLKESDEDFLLAGEVEGLPIRGFDLDNSPWNLQGKNLCGKVLVQKTTNGVKAALNALAADYVFITGFSNAKVTAEYIRANLIRSGEVSHINLIASHPTGDEDLACAEYIAGIITGDSRVDAKEAAERIQRSGPAEKFLNRSRPEFKKEDILLCLEEIDGSFIMQVNSDKGLPRIERIFI
ncbi:2-phosphosulfolactate phosphatase [Mesobacillus zeae]|uniref:Probable 2-phosphosulfolactate phosphatase n=1 Tax=Mesobacillus zeae TaxID=1917180 RepID=A0A398BFL0_9BACI|nr:2-phosphosulfolactate phosphatase [Mesobacillus zeae]RID88812.1 2-phosphosulfolactate phosphatase [Mesobacillus zeae]